MADDQAAPGVADTAKNLAEQAIDTASAVVDLAVDIPVEGARLLLSKTEALAAKLRSVLPD